MRNKHKYSLLVTILLASVIAFGQTGRSTATKSDSLQKYYTTLATSKNDSDKALLETELYKLLQSGQEKDWVTAANFFYQLKKNAVSDSIVKAAKTKFPAGQYVRNEEVQLVYNEDDPVKKEKAYKAWIKKFPPEKFGSERITYDYARNAVSVAFAKADNVAKAVAYANMIETPVWKGEGWASTAYILLQKRLNKEAKTLLKKAIDNSTLYKTERKGEQGAAFALAGLPSYLSTYADLLYKEKDYANALVYMEKASEVAEGTRKVGLNALYAKVLMAVGRNQEAFDKLDESIKHGMATTEMKDDLKVLYVKLKGNEGYDDYMAQVNRLLVAKIKTDLSKQLIKQPAPDFTLQDVDGNVVSLASLKGKTVLIDFWATWCGPCKASFPSMKRAQERFKDNPDVKFLYIHTWERGDSNAVKNAKKYVVDNNYPFEVLMDLLDPASGKNAVVESYNVTGIPTKFVIDKNGDIRFRFTGFSGGMDAAVEEVAAMIELTQKAG